MGFWARCLPAAALMYTHSEPAEDSARSLEPIRVRRWPTERLWFYLNGLVAVCLWVAFVGLAPQTLAWIGLFIGIFALMNLAFVAHIRGSAVRLGPTQFPELYARVEALARRMGLRQTPEVYLSQQDGAINAFATRFLRSHIVVLLADLLEACGDDTAARDMIIGHELGHIRAGHLRGHWLLLPATFVPFLGAALSRAREYTCDRYGRAAAGSEQGALRGLVILAAGGKYAPLVDAAALASQHRSLRRGWMVVGEWMSTHPPLSKRILALKPALDQTAVSSRREVHWLLPAAFAGSVVISVGITSMAMWLPRARARETSAATNSAAARIQVDQDLRALQALIETDRAAGRQVPWDLYELYERWSEARPGQSQPVDPFSGYWYDYDQRGDAYRLWSLGPDAINRTADDIVLDSRTAKRRSVARVE